MITRINKLNSLTDKKSISLKINSAKKYISDASNVNKKDGAALLMKALDIYIEVIDLDPKNIEAHHGLAFISYAFDENKRALGFLSKALEIDPNNTDSIKMYHEINNNIKNGQISTIISKHATNSLENASITKKLDITKNIKNTVASKILKSSSKSNGNDFFSMLQAAKSKK